MMKVGIVGGGPAGIVASVFIKQNAPETKVYIIEKQPLIGGKIPLTGNGRCNISNISISSEDYSFDMLYQDLIASILEDFDIHKLKSFLLSAGIVTVEEEDRLYPASGKAAQVRSGLECLVRELGINIINDSECCDIVKADGQFVVSYKGKDNKRSSLIVDRLVLASGSPANLKRSSDNNSLYLAKKCGLYNRDFFPALTGYICDESYDKSLAGVRAKVHISYQSFSEYGELQFTEEGISGIPVFQLSLYIGEKILKDGISVTINFLSDLPDALIDRWKTIVKTKNTTCIEELLSGLVNPKIATAVLKKCRISKDIMAAKLSEKQIDCLISSLCSYDFILKDIKPLKNSQVSLGGICFRNFDNYLQAIDCNGLFSCGEILDIAGRCGGYNLHFAFASGWRVGKGIIRSFSNFNE